MARPLGSNKGWNMRLPPERYVELLTHETELTVAGLDHVPLDAQVPACPDWTVADLVRHTGTIHRWAKGLVEAAGEKAPFPTEAPADDELGAWFLEGSDRLAAALRAAPVDRPAFTFIGMQTAGFWLRRMPGETAVHRWDLESTHTAATTPLDPELAADGISEIFEVYKVRAGEGFYADAGSRSLHLHCTDIEGEWTLYRSPDGFTVTEDHTKSTTAARGTAEALVLFLWNRTGSETLDVFGDESQLTEWQAAFNI